MMVQCPECAGVGVVATGNAEPQLCARCGGAKVIPFRSWEVKHTYHRCPDCGGAGHVGGVPSRVRGNECVQCRGDGMIAKVVLQ